LALVFIIINFTKATTAEMWKKYTESIAKRDQVTNSDWNCIGIKSKVRGKIDFERNLIKYMLYLERAWMVAYRLL